MSFYGRDAFYAPTFVAIQNRLASFSPGINLRDYVVKDPQSQAELTVHPLTLQGIDFTTEKPEELLTAIRKAKSGSEKAFKEGSTKGSDWQEHWAISASLQATRGIGFREPWRMYLNDRGLQIANARPPRMMNAPEWSNDLAANFGQANQLDMSALHVSVAYGKWTAVNIHIDETGVAMSALDNDDVTITPNLVSHTFNELLLKTFAGDHLPTWVVDRLNLHVLSPDMNYSRVGVSFDVLKGDTYKLTISASCGLTSCKDLDVQKIISLDRNALKQLNPTVSFEKRF